MPPSAAPTNHGHTTAAWTTTIVVLLGAVLAAVGMVAALTWLAWAGGAVALLGLVLGKVLQVLGYGQGGAQTLARQAASGH
ncbi:HGxxPAAW family protein [Cellulomonas soli]